MKYLLLCPILWMHFAWGNGYCILVTPEKEIVRVNIEKEACGCDG